MGMKLTEEDYLRLNKAIVEIVEKAKTYDDLDTLDLMIGGIVSQALAVKRLRFIGGIE